MPRLADVVDALQALYDPAWAEPWDAVGLVVGDPEAEVRRVLFAVDPVAAVVAEADRLGVDLLVTHHPLFLHGVHGVPATTAKGRAVHRLVRAGIALHVAHTNADVARPGVSDALAAALGVRDLRPLVPPAAEAPPREATARAGTVRAGLGRVGVLPAPEPLAAFLARAARALPRTAAGLRSTGDPEREVRTVAVCGGSGDSLLAAAAAAGADVFLTADLRHHPVSEHAERGGPALVDAAHWATEAPWLPDAAARLAAVLRGAAATVECRVSAVRTDAWTLAVSVPPEEASTAP